MCMKSVMNSSSFSKDVVRTLYHESSCGVEQKNRVNITADQEESSCRGKGQNHRIDPRNCMVYFGGEGENEHLLASK